MTIRPLANKTLQWVEANPKKVFIPASLGLNGLRVYLQSRVYAHQNLTPQARRTLNIREYVNVGLSTLFWFGAFWGTSWGLEKLFPKMKGLDRTLVSGFSAQIPDTFVRAPLAAIVSSWLIKHNFLKSASQSISQNPALRLPSQPVPSIILA